MISNGPISDDTSYITASKQKIYKIVTDDIVQLFPAVIVTDAFSL